MGTIKSGANLLVGTPGRVNDLIRRKILKIEHVKLLIIDEADEMLSKGFKEQIHNVFRELPETMQCCIFSATMPNEIFDVTIQFMNNPTQILVKNDELTLEGIKQY